METSSNHLSYSQIQSYDEIKANEVYCLQNPGGVIFLCTRGSVSNSETSVPHSPIPRDSVSIGSTSVPQTSVPQNYHNLPQRYDFAPLAWCIPYEYEPVSKLIIVCDTSHKTFHDVKENSVFAIAFPSFEMRSLIQHAGSVSGFDVDKFDHFHVPHFCAKTIDVRIPEGVVGWMECSLERIIIEGTSGILLGAVIKAFAIAESWKHRIHYLNDPIWYKPGDLISE
ncbi:MAG: Flavin reductase like domain protein [Spirochaetes bacterium ADurb.Bin110]|nr:MAG: Flavin reductase like domain protein [Spirochaetes bacterium ADurb.Bin110]